MITTFFLFPALFLILIGAIILFFGIRNKKKRKHLIKEGNIAKGIIVDNQETLIGEKNHYFSIVKVHDPIQGELKLKMKIGISLPRNVGNEIEVVYDINNQSDVYEYTNSISWVNTVFYIVGIMFIIGGSIWSAVTIILSYFITNLN